MKQSELPLQPDRQAVIDTIKALIAEYSLTAEQLGLKTSRGRAGAVPAAVRRAAKRTTRV